MAESDAIEELQKSLTCSLCGKTLMLEEDVRYVVQIRVFAAADPLEFGPQELRKDWRPELERLVRRMEKMNAEELEAQVFKEFRFFLCPRCQRDYIRDPLAGIRGRPPEPGAPQPPQAEDG